MIIGTTSIINTIIWILRLGLVWSLWFLRAIYHHLCHLNVGIIMITIIAIFILFIIIMFTCTLIVIFIPFHCYHCYCHYHCHYLLIISFSSSCSLITFTDCFKLRIRTHIPLISVSGKENSESLFFIFRISWHSNICVYVCLKLFTIFFYCFISLYLSIHHHFVFVVIYCFFIPQNSVSE